MRAKAVLSPRATPAELEDLAEKGRLIGRQRVRRQRRRPARAGGRSRARRILERLAAAALAVTVLAGAAALTGWALTSPRFAIAEVAVQGASRLEPEAIEAAAGIAPGSNLFRLDARAAAVRVAALPGVGRAEVIRSLPDRVTLVVEERQPFALAHAGRLRWLDEQGVDLGPEARAVALDHPVITGLGPADPGSGGRPPAGSVATGIGLIRLLLRAGGGLLGRISEIDVSRPDGPVLYTVRGVEVRLGEEDWEQRLGRLQGVLAQLEASGEAVASIDLRFRDQVVLNTAVR